MHFHSLISVDEDLFLHRLQIGPAIWELLWCAKHVTTETQDDTGLVWGFVLGGRPIKYQEIATALQSSQDTIKRNLNRLHDLTYIRMTRAPYGQIILVTNRVYHKMTSSNHALSHSQRAGKSATSLTDREGKNPQSHNERQGISALSNEQRTRISEQSLGNNALSNHDRDKDKKDLKDDDDKTSSLSQIETYFCNKNGATFLPGGDHARIRQMLADGISTKVILEGIDVAFIRYQPRFQGDRIRSIKYCEPIIRRLNQEKQDSTQGGTPSAAYQNEHSKFNRTTPSGKQPPQRDWRSFEFGE